MTDVKKVHQLLVDVAGPHYRDRIEIQDEDLDALTPTYHNVGDYCYERYESGDGYMEIRLDLIVSRDYSIIEQREEQEADLGLDRPPALSELEREDEPGRGER